MRKRQWEEDNGFSVWAISANLARMADGAVIFYPEDYSPQDLYQFYLAGFEAGKKGPLRKR